jgi:hypothetical protein
LLLEELRDRIAIYLSQHRVCVISTSGTVGAWAMPALYSSQDLVMECQLPRWADVGYHIEKDPQVLLIVYDLHLTDLCWMQYWGTAQLMPASNGSERRAGAASDERYVAIRVMPQRIDLFDESKGWGARETLDF